MRLIECCRRLILLIFFLACGPFMDMGQQSSPERPVLESNRLYRLEVAANTAWTDTGFDVRAGQPIRFSARGGISLQQGNPRGYCGADGLEFSTAQQPLPDVNLGSLIGKVVLLISVEVDEETGEEIRNEIVEIFDIGARQRVEMPIDGNLFLGINELVVEDNSGSLTVEFEVEPRRISAQASNSNRLDLVDQQFFQELDIVTAFSEFGIGEDILVQRNVRLDSHHEGCFQRRLHFENAFMPSRSESADLGKQRIVVRGDVPPLIGSGVHPDPLSSGHHQEFDLSR
jgi:hypothetical protein